MYSVFALFRFSDAMSAKEYNVLFGRSKSESDYKLRQTEYIQRCMTRFRSLIDILFNCFARNHIHTSQDAQWAHPNNQIGSSI